MALSDDPADAVWPDYFRAEVVKVELESQLNDDDELADDFYNTEAAWFQSGWKARDLLQQAITPLLKYQG